MNRNKNKLVTLIRSAHLHRIQIAQQLLANNHIKSYIVDANIDLVYTRSFIEGIRLQINADDIQAAEEILKESKLFDD